MSSMMSLTIPTILTIGNEKECATRCGAEDEGNGWSRLVFGEEGGGLVCFER